MTATSQPRAGGRTRGPQLRQLTLLSTRELLRNVKTLFSLLFIFFFFLIVIFGVDAIVNGRRDAPVVSIASGSGSSAVVDALQRRGVDVRTGGDHEGVNARITVSDDHARIVLSETHSPAWKELVAAVHSTGVATSRIAVLDASGASETDVLRINLATALGLGFMAIAFMGTSVPLVSLRQRGALRLLGTTPARRSLFILGQSPVRFGLGLVEAAVVVVIAWWQGYVDFFDIPRLLVTLILGLAMFFAFAYLIACRATNTELVTQLSGLLPVIVIGTAGTIFPMELFPDVVRYAMDAVPSTWFMQAASADIVGTQPFFPVYWLWLMLAAITVAVGGLAARLFTWDQGDL